MKKVLISVSGKAGAGKSEFANIAVSDYGFVEIPFAKALKEEVSEFLAKYNIPFEEKNIYGSQEDKEQLVNLGNNIGDIIEEHPWLEGKCRDLTFRYLLQLWGTEYRRESNENYWVERAFTKAQKYDRVVISDCRFFNEYSATRLVGGYTVRIERPDAFQSNTSSHPSETSLDHIRNWNYKIKNTGAIDSFRTSCKYILDEICKE